ncbi:MAG: helix-turn-helix domain-containing protein [Pseudomonadota bacterium]
MSDTVDSSRSDFPIARRDIDPVLRACPEDALTRVLESVGYDAAFASGSGDTLLPLTDYFRILKALASELHDETVHLSSRHLMPGATGYIVGSLASSTSLYEAMKTIARSYNMLHGGSYNHVEQRDGCIVYTVDDRHFPYRLDDSRYIHLTLECVLIFLHCMLISITPGDLSAKLRKVYIKRDRAISTSRHMEFWKVPIRYHSGTYALIYDLDASTLPVDVAPGITPSSEEIYDDVIRVIEAASSASAQRPDIVRQVEHAIEKRMYSQVDTAKYLGCSVATLRRRLQERNCSYREITEATLNRAALRMLRQGLKTSEIAEELGFSDFRSFTRAFKRWNGVTPRQYTQNPPTPG